MSLLEIPAGNALPWYKFNVTLNDVLYTLRFRYNTRSSRWILDIADAANQDIVVGLPVLIGRNLTGRFVIEGIPPGLFLAADLTNQDEQPGRYSFGVDHVLLYEDGT